MPEISSVPAPRIALVTGASRGIGAAIAEDLAAAGYRVVVNYRADRPGADTVVRRIQEAGGLAEAAQADVAKRDEVARLFAADRGAVRRRARTS